jgi:uncharacterized coiled-coil DUF342 family protein
MSNTNMSNPITFFNSDSESAERPQEVATFSESAELHQEIDSLLQEVATFCKRTLSAMQILIDMAEGKAGARQKNLAYKQINNVMNSLTAELSQLRQEMDAGHASVEESQRHLNAFREQLQNSEETLADQTQDAGSKTGLCRGS